MLFLLIGLLGSTATAAFSYFRYRAYINLVRHVADRHGVDGLNSMSSIAPPQLSAGLSSRRIQIHETTSVPTPANDDPQ